jgi:replicative DNA helicase Mcm
LVSGNPEDGRFDKYESIPEQVDLDPALISRLDILLGVQDIPDPDFDSDVADHVLDSWDQLSSQEAAQMANESVEIDEENITRPIDKELFRAAVYYAREHIYPTLTTTAKEKLAEFYVETRDMNESDAVPITARKLLAGIRIATAFARAEFSETVEAHHAERAIDLSKMVIGLNLDQETGDLDVDKQLTGETKAQKDRKQAIKDVVEELEDAENGADTTQILQELTAEGYAQNKIETDIEKLKNKGEFYEPVMGELRST